MVYTVNKFGVNINNCGNSWLIKARLVGAVKLSKVASRTIDLPEDFSFELMASAYNFSWYFDGSELIIPIGHGELTIAVVGKEGKEELRITLFSQKKINYVDALFEKVEDVIGINEDLKDFHKIWRRDPLLSQSYDFLRGFRLRKTGLWNALLIGVCQQNASFRQGWNMLALIYKNLGLKVEIEGGKATIVPPSPERIARSSVGELRKCKLGYRAEAVKKCAEAFYSGILSEEDVDKYGEEDLTRVKGIGKYTARLALILSDRRYELPPIDRWLARIISEVYNVSVGEAEGEWVSRWGKWCGLAAFITTLALDAEPLTQALRRIREGRVTPTFNESKVTPLTLWKFI